MEILQDIIQTPIFCQMSIYALQLAVCLYEIEMVRQSGVENPLNTVKYCEKTNILPMFQNCGSFSLLLVAPMTGVVLVSAINCVLCYFITTSTINGMWIGDLAYGLRWYQLLPDDQFILQGIIQRAQRPCELKVWGMFVCSLETFLKVILIS